jgi:succinate-semialdehyde dehydrogenase/glutarate-semialdehyde dehydrogenase
MAVAANTIRVANPATGEELAVYEEHTPEQLRKALAEAHAAQSAWRDVPLAERRRLMRCAEAVLRERRGEYARLMTLEMGKPIAESEAEIDKCAWNCEFYAAEAERFLADVRVETDAQRSFVAHEPIGVVLAIMPWNFPFWQVLRFAAPALMAGNGALLKHSPNASGSALAIEELFEQAGFLAGLFRTLLIGDASVAEATGRLIEDPRVAAVTLTGSERAGAAVGAAAARDQEERAGAGRLGPVHRARRRRHPGSRPAGRPVALPQQWPELPRRQALHRRPRGGRRVRGALRRGRRRAAGRRSAGPRHAGRAAGPPGPARGARAPGRGVGGAGRPRAGRRPSARPARQLLRAHGPVRRRPRHARVPRRDVRAGGRRHPCRRRRARGPARQRLALRPRGASVWTRDVERGLRVGRGVTSGALFVNGVVASDPRLPFGGTKRSGYGRELAAEGIREFVNTRTIWIGPAEGLDTAGPPTE